MHLLTHHLKFFVNKGINLSSNKQFSNKKKKKKKKSTRTKFVFFFFCFFYYTQDYLM